MYWRQLLHRSDAYQGCNRAPQSIQLFLQLFVQAIQCLPQTTKTLAGNVYPVSYIYQIIIDFFHKFAMVLRQMIYQIIIVNFEMTLNEKDNWNTSTWPAFPFEFLIISRTSSRSAFFAIKSWFPSPMISGQHQDEVSLSSFVHFFLGSQIHELNWNTLLAKIAWALPLLVNSVCVCACSTAEISPLGYIIEILSSHIGRVNYVHVGHKFQLKQVATYSRKIQKIGGQIYSPFNCNELCKLLINF